MKVLTYGPADPTSPVTVFLHGFPGIRSKQNREIAEAVANQAGRTVHVLLYPGLGHCPGIFSFEQCIQNVRGHFSQLCRSVQDVRLVGHSWGGYLSLLMAHEFPGHIRRMVLLSPLLRFTEVELVGRALGDFASNNPELSLLELEVLAQEWVRIGERHPPEKLVSSLSADLELLFLQAKDDPVTPTSVALDVLPRFSCRTEFRLVDQDHSFLLERPALAEQIGTWLFRP